MALSMILWVVGFNPSENIWVSWDDEIPFPAEWKVVKAMFQTTNQLCLVYEIGY